jgi:hypothetical protein
MCVRRLLQPPILRPNGGACRITPGSDAPACERQAIIGRIERAAPEPGAPDGLKPKPSLAALEFAPARNI